MAVWPQIHGTTWFRSSAAPEMEQFEDPEAAPGEALVSL